MFWKRRDLLVLAAGGAALGLLPAAASRARAGRRIEALAFDAFPIFDPSPVAVVAERLFPGHGRALSETWRTRQFEYQWLRALGGRYADFWRTTEDALSYSATLLRLDLTPDRRELLMQTYLELPTWPDAAPALAALRRAGTRLAVLSNATPRILSAGIRRAGLDGIFEHVLSTDGRRTYKPAALAYQMAPDAFGLPVEAIGFVAFAGWDVAGAKWFGFPTFWVNRLSVPVEELGVAPDGIGQDLHDLARFVGVGSP